MQLAGSSIWFESRNGDGARLELGAGLDHVGLDGLHKSEAGVLDGLEGLLLLLVGLLVLLLELLEEDLELGLGGLDLLFGGLDLLAQQLGGEGLEVGDLGLLVVIAEVDVGGGADGLVSQVRTTGMEQRTVRECAKSGGGMGGVQQGRAQHYLRRGCFECVFGILKLPSRTGARRKAFRKACNSPKTKWLPNETAGTRRGI